MSEMTLGDEVLRDLEEYNRNRDCKKFFEGFFEDEFNKCYTEKIACEETEDGCDEGMKEGTLVDGFYFDNRMIIFIKDDTEIVFFRENDEEEYYPEFKFGEDIFKGKTYEIVPELAKSFIYQADVIIFSQGKEIFSGAANIGEVINMVIKEQARLLYKKVEKYKEEQVKA